MTDCVCFVSSLAFTGCGFLMLISGREPGKALATTVFFGACAAMNASTLMTRYRQRRNALVRQVRVVGGEPIRFRKRRMIGLSAGIVALGTVMAGASFGCVFAAAGIVIALGGLAVLTALLTGRAGNEALVFEPEGLRFLRVRWSYLLRWDNLSAIMTTQVHGNPILLIWIRDRDGLVDSIRTEGGDERDLAEWIHRSVRSHQAWYGCDLSIMPSYFGIDLTLLAMAIQRYARNPESRTELRRRPRLPSTCQSP